MEALSTQIQSLPADVLRDITAYLTRNQVRLCTTLISAEDCAHKSEYDEGDLLYQIFQNDRWRFQCVIWAKHIADLEVIDRHFIGQIPSAGANAAVYIDSRLYLHMGYLMTEGKPDYIRVELQALECQESVTFYFDIEPYKKAFDEMLLDMQKRANK